ncbi:hypothetical protein [Spirosoma sp.]|uniref:hypothetical protein n=1 Tax=Spirosoma sp. TaxID=1899569 RepID=UPI003B3A1E06
MLSGVASQKLNFAAGLSEKCLFHNQAADTFGVCDWSYKRTETLAKSVKAVHNAVYIKAQPLK